jgi:hypothetical protein
MWVTGNSRAVRNREARYFYSLYDLVFSFSFSAHIQSRLLQPALGAEIPYFSKNRNGQGFN